MNLISLGVHAKLIRGITFKPNEICDLQDKEAVICLRTKNVQATLDTSDLIAIPRSLIKNPEKMILKGDILVSSANSWNLVGKCCQVRELQYPSTAGGFISILRTRTNELDSAYLYRWFSSDEIQRKVRSFGNQTTNISNLDHKKILNLQIPLPPFAEQKRIAAILDVADALRAKRRESIALLDTLLQSTFLDMFGDPITNPMGWEMGVIGDLLKSANYGTSKKANSEKGSYPILRMNNITYSGEWDFSSLKYIDLDEKELPKHLVHRGEILFNRTNSKELVGKTAVFRKSEPMAFAGYLVRGIVNELADPEYIGAFMNTPQIKTFLRNNCKNIVGMANINAKEFQKIPIPKPPVDLQCRFAAIVESVERQKVRLRAHLAELDALFASLQQRAFNGEL
ncbi:restriction endonuclease subunit S [Candidatus Protochlamydia phocaeensis]|uniref:restriction endonuclease subunit S n=1 Tax=Candidatus Protochlamydia phocaeensis TaxID=1414722 RepID=UPI0009AC8FBD|nr:restriction endonuclease subunit S [Candidatus Protochlamydia phocaeensis]